MRKGLVKRLLSLSSIFILSSSMALQGSGVNVLADDLQPSSDTSAQAEASEEEALAGASTIEDGGIYVFNSQVGDGKVLDISNASYNERANLQIYQSNGTNAQKFIAEENDDGTFSFYAYCSGYAMDIQGGSKASGTNVWQYHGNNSDAQKWSVISNADGTFTFMSALGTVLDVQNGSSFNGTNVQAYKSNGTPAQKFRAIKTGNTDNKYFGKKWTLVSCLSSTETLEEAGNTGKSGSNADISSSGETSFRIDYGRDGCCRLVSENGLVLDVQGGGLANFTNVQFYNRNNTLAQNWRIESNDDGTVTIYSALSGKSLDVYGGGRADGTNVQIYEPNGTDAQKWFIKNSDSDIVILSTNDVHCAVDQNTNTAKPPLSLGYTGVEAYENEMESDGNFVLLVDCGDAVQGGAIGTLSKGSYITDIMNEAGYDLAIPGNHEFDYGMDQFFSLVKKADFPYLSCNFVQEPSEDPVFAPYKLVTLGNRKIGFIGATTPQTITSSTPVYFQDGNGNYIYGFLQDTTGEKLKGAIQASADALKAQGADYVILMAHLGIDSASSPYMSTEIIQGTTGIDAVLDGHSHSVVNENGVKNADGENVVLLQTGTKLANLGKLTISSDGIKSDLISAGDYTGKSEAMDEYISNIEGQYTAMLAEVVGHTNYPLYIMDPSTPSVRIIRNTETNLGNLTSDAVRKTLGSDIAFTNGGGIRANIPAGDITYGELLNVHPFGNQLAEIEVTGQQIKDALEWSVSAWPNEFGGFLHGSGITYTVNTTIPSTVTKDSSGMFTGVSGEYRVSNIMIGNEPIDLSKTYTVGGTNYTLINSGDGYTMFKGCKVLVNEGPLDVTALINYVKVQLQGEIPADYAEPYGQGRITWIK